MKTAASYAVRRYRNEARATTVERKEEKEKGGRGEEGAVLRNAREEEGQRLYSKGWP